VDPLSQGALGAAVAASPARARRVAIAAGLGALSGMAPDLDVLIRSPSDPLLFLEYHRQFTHALAFVPVGALICALAAYPLARRWLGFGAVYGFCLLGYASHGLLDACTSYGTQLLWPFADTRVAWNAIAVIDPAFTLPIVALVVLAAWRRVPGLAVAALVWALAYLGLGAWQHGRAHAAAVAVAAERGHDAARFTVKPSFGNLLVWKSIYLADGHFYVDALRIGRAVTRYPGDRTPRLETARDLSWLTSDSRQAHDLERFRRFSDDYLALLTDQPPHFGAIVGDIRYSLVPNRIDPLWGIRLTREGGDDPPARFVQNSRASPEERQALWAMIRGKPVDEEPRHDGNGA
jgi:inner membrane protein